MAYQKKITDLCTYSLYSTHPRTGIREAIRIKKNNNKITVIIKGNAGQKNTQFRLLTQRFRAQDIQQLSTDTYLLNITSKPFDITEGCLQYARRNGMIAHHTYSPLNNPSTCYYFSDQVIIRFNGTAKKQQVQSIIKKYHLQVTHQSALITNQVIALTTEKSGSDANNPRGKNPAKVAEMLQAEPLVKTADVSLISVLTAPKRKEPQALPASIQKAKMPNAVSIQPGDNLFKYQWYLQAGNQPNIKRKFKVDPDAGIDAVKTWELLGHRGSKEITIAVIDLSLNFNHPDLKSQLYAPIKNITGNFVFHDGEGSIPDSFLIGSGEHGTQCAGIAAAAENGKGIVGIASGCRLLPVWLDANASEATKIRCFEEVSAHADVISFSLAPTPEKMIGDGLIETITYITTHGGPRKKGCVMCVCAGNNQVPIHKKLTAGLSYYDDDGIKQTLKKGEEIYNLFAAHKGVITITACTGTNKAASYNNYGAEVSICAPSADWDLKKGMNHLISAGIYTTTGNGLPDAPLYTDSFCGTSAAAPLVAGVTALMLSANNQLTAGQVKQILEQTADKINERDARYNQDGHSEVYGFGKINAVKAVQQALDLKKPAAQSV